MKLNPNIEQSDLETVTKIMKARKTLAVLLLGACAALFVSGCRTADYAYDPVNPPQPYTFPGQTTPAAATQPQLPGPAIANPNPVVINHPAVVPNPSSPAQPAISGFTLRAGDVVMFSFTDIPTPMIDQRVQIAEDGTLTLPLNVRVQAMGKNPRQLEQEIRSEYVPKYYKYLTVTLKTEQRAFFVGGEVKVPNRYPYTGQDITVLRAIQAAGDFTDFANRKTIELIRESGQKEKINWYKAIENPKLDLPVYPNDQIIVRKRVLW